MLETQDWKDFSISSWYEKFKHIVIETVILELCDDVLKTLKYSENVVESDSEETINKEEPVVIPLAFRNNLKNAFNILGKTVFVKNNWHAPMDAKMFSIGNTLKAQNMDDISLYFSVSDVIQEDFSNIRGVQFCLALRPWISIHPAAEFRCVVIKNVLRGITPRDWPTFYSHYKEEGKDIIEKIKSFFVEHIQMKFPRQNYIFDAVLAFPDPPFVLDFGPLNNKTNLYAFSWKEICPLLTKEVPEEVSPVFRYLDTSIGIMTQADALHKIRLSQ